MSLTLNATGCGSGENRCLLPSSAATRMRPGAAAISCSPGVGT